MKIGFGALIDFGNMEELPLDIVNKIMLYVTHHPVAMSYTSTHNLYDKMSNEKCFWRGYCACDNCRHMLSVSKAELLYIIKKPSYKLEKVLEMKVIMNWVVKKVGYHHVNPDLSMEKRIIYHRWLWGELQKKKKKKRSYVLSFQ